MAIFQALSSTGEEGVFGILLPTKQAPMGMGGQGMDQGGGGMSHELTNIVASNLAAQQNAARER